MFGRVPKNAATAQAALGLPQNYVSVVAQFLARRNPCPPPF